MFNGKTHYKLPFSIAMLNYQRVSHRKISTCFLDSHKFHRKIRTRAVWDGRSWTAYFSWFSGMSFSTSTWATLKHRYVLPHVLPLDGCHHWMWCSGFVEKNNPSFPAHFCHKKTKIIVIRWIYCSKNTCPSIFSQLFSIFPAFPTFFSPFVPRFSCGHKAASLMTDQGVMSSIYKAKVRVSILGFFMG